MDGLFPKLPISRIRTKKALPIRTCQAIQGWGSGHRNESITLKNTDTAVAPIAPAVGVVAVAAAVGLRTFKPNGA